jgi:hypothetical protein
VEDLYLVADNRVQCPICALAAAEDQLENLRFDQCILMRQLVSLRKIGQLLPASRRSMENRWPGRMRSCLAQFGRQHDLAFGRDGGRHIGKILKVKRESW